MTCREKFRSLFPNTTSELIERVVVSNCPRHFDILQDPPDCDFISCSECWDREIPETNDRAVNIPPEEVTKLNEVIDKTMTPKTTTKKTKAELLSEITDLKKEVEKLDKYRKYADMADELAIIRDILIDTGFTREEALQIIFRSIMK